MNPANEQIALIYTKVMERVILNTRMRIRCGEIIEQQEIHDLMDAIHNIPTMLVDYGRWYVEENINADLARYDELWPVDDEVKRRESLIGVLEDVKSRILE